MKFSAGVLLAQLWGITTVYCVFVFSRTNLGAKESRPRNQVYERFLFKGSALVRPRFWPKPAATHLFPGWRHLKELVDHSGIFDVGKCSCKTNGKPQIFSLLFLRTDAFR